MLTGPRCLGLLGRRITTWPFCVIYRRNEPKPPNAFTVPDIEPVVGDLTDAPAASHIGPKRLRPGTRSKSESLLARVERLFACIRATINASPLNSPC
jgi:hypothetical protein